MLLEFRLHKLGEFLLRHLFSRDVVAILILLRLFLLGSVRSNDEYLISSGIAERESVQNVATILAIILAQSPSEGFA